MDLSLELNDDSDGSIDISDEEDPDDDPGFDILSPLGAPPGPGRDGGTGMRSPGDRYTSAVGYTSRATPPAGLGCGLGLWGHIWAGRG